MARFRLNQKFLFAALNRHKPVTGSDNEGLMDLRQVFDDLVRFETVLWVALDQRPADTDPRSDRATPARPA